MESYAYFPSVVYRDERLELTENIKAVCLSYLDAARGAGWRLCQSASLIGVPELSNIVSYLNLSAREILHSQGYDMTKYELYVSGLWAQELDIGAASDVHAHKNSQMCGWAFLEAPKNGAYPIYYDARTCKGMVELDFIQCEEIVNATSAIHFNNVIPGTILFGNSWLKHQLTASRSDKPTRCLHFIISHREK